MSLDVGATLRSGYARLRTPAGLQIAAIAVLVQLGANVFTDSRLAALPDQQLAGAPVEPGPLALDLPPGVLAVLGLVVTVVSILFTLVALRTFVSGATASIPAEHYTENLLLPTIRLFVGGIVFLAAVVIGLVLFVLPGLVVLVSLFFFQVYIASEGEGVVASMRSSWRLASGHRVRLFVLGVGVFVVAVAVGVAFGILGAAAETVSPPLAGVVETVGGAVVTTYVLATLVAAYEALTATDLAAAATDDAIDTDWHR